MHFKSIDDIIKELDKPVELKWPCRTEKEVTFYLTFEAKFLDERNIIVFIPIFSCILFENHQQTLQWHRFASFQLVEVYRVQWN